MSGVIEGMSDAEYAAYREAVDIARNEAKLADDDIFVRSLWPRSIATEFDGRVWTFTQEMTVAEFEAEFGLLPQSATNAPR